MHNQVTVEKAIHNGKMTVIYPMGFCLIISPIICLFLLKKYENSIGHGLWIPIGLWIGLIIGFISMILYWKYASVKWQFWAFENVRNVHELKEKAIQNKLISDKNFILIKRKTAINYEQKRKLERIKAKFEEEDKYYDDLTAQKETIIRIPKASHFLISIIGIFFVGISIYAYFNFSIEFYKIAIPFILGTFLLISIIKVLKDNEPKLILNSSGIKVYKKDFLQWSEINDCSVKKEFAGNYNSYCLVINYNNSEVINFNINGLDKKPEEIEKLIKIYKIRFDKQFLIDNKLPFFTIKSYGFIFKK